jgi:hypothetical protein
VLGAAERIGRVKRRRDRVLEEFEDDVGFKMAASPTRSTGTLPVGDSALNQSGLSERSMSTRSNGCPFSFSEITAR